MHEYDETLPANFHLHVICLLQYSDENGNDVPNEFSEGLSYLRQRVQDEHETRSKLEVLLQDGQDGGEKGRKKTVEYLGRTSRLD